MSCFQQGARNLSLKQRIMMSATGTRITANFKEAAEVPSTWALLVSGLGVRLCSHPEEALVSQWSFPSGEGEKGGKHREGALSPPTSQKFTEAHRSQINQLFSHIKTVGDGAVAYLANPPPSVPASHMGTGF